MSKGSGKVRRVDRYRYLTDDPADATQALADAQLAERRARGTDAHAAAQEHLQAAEQALDDCYGTIVLRALAPAVHESYLQEFTERDDARAAAVKEAEEAGQQPPAEPKVDWGNEQALEVRLIASCDTDASHTAAWWAAEFAGDEWTLAERDDLLDRCFRLNVPRSSFDLGVLGKG